MVARPGSETLRAHSCKSISGFIFASNHLHSSHNTLSSSQITHSSHSPTVLSILSHTHSSSIAHPSTGESHPSTGEIAPRTHPLIDPPRPPARSRHKPTNRSTHPVSDPHFAVPDFRVCLSLLLSSQICESTTNILRGATPLAQPIASNSAHIIINAIGWASCTLNILRGSVFFFFLPFLLLKLTSDSRFFVFVCIYNIYFDYN